ncbi:MAG: phosphoribosylformylglycinamidine synthase, partial [Oscillospiraceae bacterium]|nr:phosphoribosylformylglycinamidine synthase [Oscillospiraceae bacterium]
PACDVFFTETLPDLQNKLFLCVETLPGQFDVRADSCEQCIQLLLGGERPTVRTAVIYAFSGINDSDFVRVKDYLINPVECREGSHEIPQTLTISASQKCEQNRDDIPEIADLSEFVDGLAMSSADLDCIRDYFGKIGRNPTLTELRVLDTYWSDHCRHSTFNTVIESAEIYDARVERAYEHFRNLNGDSLVTLMRIATIGGKVLETPVVDVSDEINACTVRVKANFADSASQDWLLFFKNETHNHPTEIEPFGGAATCIGGAIRDPLSGRGYVYQSMRITGAADPRTPIEKTIPGKLPQRKLTTSAADGFSSYGNQIGLATGYVKELYHPGYAAKRLEAGAVVGAAPAEWVRRECPLPDDVVILLGGRTGRDGIGGATGSSKTHGGDTVSECAAEVQKGNPPEERKLQRLFRNPDVTLLIKRCNDFGAGGASVAIGELADGVEINLDAFPLKYDGLNGTEIAISESQERMAVVVSPNDVEALKEYAKSENIEATVVAKITAEPKLTMLWKGRKIVDIDRDFLDTNGAVRCAAVIVPNLTDKTAEIPLESFEELQNCSQKGLVERFDSSIGAGSIFMPFGGKFAATETQVMASLLPVSGTTTASVMAYGFEPYTTDFDPFGGGVFSVVTSVAKLIAAGVSLDSGSIHLSLQEYFPRVNDEPLRWGKPFAAMLGAFSAQMGLKIAAIGGKDSMSGTFAIQEESEDNNELNVPDTLISFAVGVAEAAELISPEFKQAGNPVYLLETPLDCDGMPDYARLRSLWGEYSRLLRDGKIFSAWVIVVKNGSNSCKDGIAKMAFGNMLGFTGEIPENIPAASIIFESCEDLERFRLLGYTQEKPFLNEMPLEVLYADWQAPLEGVFPTRIEQPGEAPTISGVRQSAPSFRQNQRNRLKSGLCTAVIPVFPGTNCEYDTAAAVHRAGGEAKIVGIANLTPQMLEDSVVRLESAIREAQMLILPGGFSGGDEPDGSAKFIVSLFRNPRLSDAVHDLIRRRDGLILGICNGFQALVKLGLLPYGEILPQTSDSPTLTFNRIGRHQSRYVTTRLASVNSPWLSLCNPGELYVQPVSHGEGRFVASEDCLDKMKSQGQIVFQYVDYNGRPSMDIEFNPNGSDFAIEGICSPDGRILGKMAHSERYGELVARNIPGNKFLPIFESGVKYFA